MNTSELFKIAVEELRKVAGDQYLKDNYKNTTISHNIDPDSIVLPEADSKDYLMLRDLASLPPIGKEYHFFAGFKTADDLPGFEANDHGWVSYAHFILDTDTGKVTHSDYKIV